MTDMAIHTDTTDIAVPATGNSLIEWAESARAAHGIAKSLAATPFVPESFNKDPALVTAAILVGQEVGLQPMAALRSLDIVKGTPALRAHAMRGLVQSHGHEIWPREQTETRVVMCGRRKGTDQIVESVWTMDRAKKLGLAGGRNYTSQPMTMLIARATSETCRLIAADVLLGIPYSAEELADDIDPDGATVTDLEPRKKRTARRAPITVQPAAHQEPALDDESPSPGDDWPAVAEPPLDGETA